jgi:4-amino-4-deoxy-L-arabinose transferase-like glycosyltransferase
LSRRSLLLVAIGAIAVRVAYIVVVIPHYVPMSDADQYQRLSRAVSRGKGLILDFPFAFLHPTAFRPPLYPVLLGAVYSVTGVHVGVGQALNVALGVVVVLMAAVLAARIAGPNAGIVAGALVAVFPPLVANDATILSEPLSLVLLLGVALLLLDGRVGWAGALSGLLVLTRPSAQAFAVVIGAWVLARFGWRRCAQYLVIVLLVVTPWVLRNWLLIGSPMVVSSNGFNLAAIYSADAQRQGAFVDPVFDVRFERFRYLRYNEAEWDAELRRVAFREIRHHPDRVLRVARDNAESWFELKPASNDLAERLDGRRPFFRHATLWLFYPVVIAGLVGLVLARRRQGAQLLLIVAVYFTLFSMFTVAPPRLRAPFDLACCIGLGVLVAAVGARRAERVGATT